MSLTVEGVAPAPAQTAQSPGFVLRAVVPALVLAAVGSACLLWGASYPGFPLSAVVIAFFTFVVAVGVTFSARPRGLRTIALLGAVALVLGAGVVTSVVSGDALLQARWSRSVSAFEQQVEILGPPSPVSLSGADGWEAAGFAPKAPQCPAMLGAFTLSGCENFAGGYLFVQAPGALTDTSGIVYLPEGRPDPESNGLYPSGFTPLGGPWWSWTCYC